MQQDLTPIYNFLACRTPDAWIQVALTQLPILLIDHANCEKKAASTAMNLMFRYVDRQELLVKMSQLAREELLHFEQVIKLMENRGDNYIHINAARYASSLREAVRQPEPQRLVDLLIIGAFVEARSCERFAALLEPLKTAGEGEIAKFYQSLLRSEARHFEDYLHLARLYSKEPIDERVAFFRQLEAQLIESTDREFRFHSGVPQAAELI